MILKRNYILYTILVVALIQESIGMGMKCGTFMCHGDVECIINDEKTDLRCSCLNGAVERSDNVNIYCEKMELLDHSVFKGGFLTDNDPKEQKVNATSKAVKTVIDPKQILNQLGDTVVDSSGSDESENGIIVKVTNRDIEAKNESTTKLTTETKSEAQAETTTKSKQTLYQLGNRIENSTESSDSKNKIGVKETNGNGVAKTESPIESTTKANTKSTIETENKALTEETSKEKQNDPIDNSNENNDSKNEHVFKSTNGKSEEKTELLAESTTKVTNVTTQLTSESTTEVIAESTTQSPPLTNEFTTGASNSFSSQKSEFDLSHNIATWSSKIENNSKKGTDIQMLTNSKCDNGNECKETTETSEKISAKKTESKLNEIKCSADQNCNNENQNCTNGKCNSNITFIKTQVDETSEFTMNINTPKNFDNIANLYDLSDINYNCANDQIQCQNKCCNSQQMCNSLGKCVEKINQVEKAEANRKWSTRAYMVIGVGCIVAALGFALFKVHKFRRSSRF